MGVREQVVADLHGLWADGGEGVLRRAGLGAAWSDVVAPIPDELLQTGSAGAASAELVLGRLRDLYAKAGRSREALAFARAVYERTSTRLGASTTGALMAQAQLGVLLNKLERAEEAHPHLDAAWRGLNQHLHGPDSKLAAVAAALGRVLRHLGEPEAALARLEDALRMRRVLTPGKTGLLTAQVAELRIEMGMEEDAAPLLQEAWESLCRDRGEHHRLSVDRARALSSLWLRLDEHARAVPVFQSLWAWVKDNGEPHERAQVGFDLGRALDATARPEQGLRLMEEALKLTRTLPTDDGRPHPDLPQRLATWARLSEGRGRRQEAEGFLLEAIELERQLYGSDSAQVGIRQAALGDLAYRMGRLDDAIGWVDAGLDLVRSGLGDEHELSALVAERLIDLLLEKADHCFDVLKDPSLGWEYVFRGQAVCLDVLGPDHPSHKALKYYRGYSG
ncbi:MAG: tetratricopeptide repeat protein [Myxococcota bacterium]